MWFSARRATRGHQNSHHCGLGWSQESQHLPHQALCWALDRFGACPPGRREEKAWGQQETQSLTHSGCFCGSWLDIGHPEVRKPQDTRPCWFMAAFPALGKAKLAE